MMSHAYAGIFPYLMPDARVLELGPGKGSWSKAILDAIRQGQLHTVDFQNVEQWLQPSKYQGRLVCHTVTDNSFSCAPDEYFDFFWSFGVLCHNNREHILKILKNSLPKMKKSGVAVHEYSGWDRLNRYGWIRGGIPVEF